MLSMRSAYQHAFDREYQAMNRGQENLAVVSLLDIKNFRDFAFPVLLIFLCILATVYP